MDTFKFKRLSPAAKAPERRADSIGYDLHAAIDGVIPSGVTAKVPLGLAFEFDLGYGAFIWGRSGKASQGIAALGFLIEEDTVIRLAGCIEGTYRGEWQVLLSNLGKTDFSFKTGDKVAQVVFQKVEFPTGEEVNELMESARGKNGWGSTEAIMDQKRDVITPKDKDLQPNVG